MAEVGISTPAQIWRAFFILVTVSCLSAFAAAPIAAVPELAQVDLPDATAARILLEKFRESGLPGRSYLEFELHALPRRGEERIYRGQLWSSRNDQGAITRVELTDSAGKSHRWLLQNGASASVWALTDRQSVQFSPAAMLKPLIPGVDISPFDLLMPYLYWPDAALVRLERIRGRPAYAFVFRPPAAFAVAHPEVAMVRGYLDTQFNALMQAERRAADGRVLATLSLGELKKVNDRWMVKSVEFRNEATRDKTRFLVTAAAFNLDLAEAVFEPARLSDDVAPPRSERLVRLSP